jgi:hypothetical protein
MLVFMHATVIKIFKCFDGLNKKYYKQKKKLRIKKKLS